MVRITIWNEFIHEKSDRTVAEVYPDGLHRTIADGLTEHLGASAHIRTATLDMAEHGLSEAVLDETDVLLWWGHAAHDRVDDRIVERVQQRVLGGMGLVALHSAHGSKIFRRLMGTSCMLRWREAGERERLWIVDPSHPIVHGIEGEFFELPRVEMYGEFFDIPAPDELILVSWFEGGEVFRSLCTFRRGAGKIVYFRPGHETYPIYYDRNVRSILAGAAVWAGAAGAAYVGTGRNIADPLSPIADAQQGNPSLHKKK
jgi:trehalose utilization protein